MNYGTAGFRSNSDNIINISFKIGIILSYMCHKYNVNYGIMITASHNIYTDNGVKIVNGKGNMISKDEENDLVKYVINNGIITYDKTNKNYKIYIGYDTRYSSKTIFNKITDGINSCDNNINIINFGLVSTPEHHFKINDDNYIYYIVNLLNKTDNNIKINIDCANGIAKYTFQNIYNLIDNKKWINTTNFINFNTKKYELLNNNCGTDYFINNKDNELNLEDGIYGSVDGDADRSIFLKIKDNKMDKLYDGDTLSYIYLYYIINYCNIREEDICVVYTSYSNGGFINHIKNIFPNVILKCSKTGVKNCDKVARSYGKVGIYFENNGHGTVLKNENIDLKFVNYINPIVGDGVINILLILCLLNIMNKDFEYFEFKKYNLSNYKISNVCNKDDYINDDNETELIEPLFIVNKINEIKEKYNLNRIFIRKSGTENILRVLIEGDENHIECFNELKKYIII